MTTVLARNVPSCRWQAFEGESATGLESTSGDTPQASPDVVILVIATKQDPYSKNDLVVLLSNNRDSHGELG